MLQETNSTGHDKVARYGWVVTSAIGRFGWIDKKRLRVNNDDYQRDHAKQKVLDLSSKWSWISCGALTVAERNGELWVVDGQHRLLAANKRSDIKELPCMVFKVETLGDEARAFLATNTNRKPVTALGKFKAMVAARDPVALRVQDVINRAGLRLASASSDTGDFKAVALALELAERDFSGFSEVMLLAAEMARDEKSPVQQRLVMGLYHIHTHIDGGILSGRIGKRIKQVGIASLLTGADRAAAYYARGGARVYAEGMLQEINARLHQKFELAVAA